MGRVNALADPVGSVPAAMPQEANLVELSGQKQVEKISIGDRSRLQEEIDKSEESPMVAIAVLVAYAVVAAGAICTAIWVSVAWAPLVLAAGFVAIAAPAEYIIYKKAQKMEALKACHEAMGGKEFREFAVLHFGQDHFTLEQMLKVHRLFQEEQSIEQMKDAFRKNAAALFAEFYL